MSVVLEVEDRSKRRDILVEVASGLNVSAFLHIDGVPERLYSIEYTYESDSVRVVVAFNVAKVPKLFDYASWSKDMYDYEVSDGALSCPDPVTYIDELDSVDYDSSLLDAVESLSLEVFL